MFCGYRSGQVASASGANGKPATPAIDSDSRESHLAQPGGNGRGEDRNKGAAFVDDAMHPTIIDFECEKESAGSKNTINLREGAILQFLRVEMMKNQNSDGGRKGTVSKGQDRCIALHDEIPVTSLDGAKPGVES